MSSPQQRSRDWLKKSGYHIGTVEMWLTFPERINGRATGKMIRTKRDLFNFADLVAIKPDESGTLYIQTTTTANQAARAAKVLDNPIVKDILKSGNRIHIHGWAQVGPRGKRKLWKVTITEVTSQTSCRVIGEQELDSEGAKVDTLF